RSTVLATGTLEPLVKVLVGSRVSGNVVAWYKDFNDVVKENELLAELDQDRLSATIVQRKSDLLMSQAGVNQAKARLAETSLQLKRIQSAFERKASSEFELESAKIAVQEAEGSLQAEQARVDSAQAQLEAAEIDLTYSKILSPIDGVVISRDIDVGQTVAASLQAPTLFTIAKDLKRMRVNAAVSETDVGQVREGMTAEFRVDAFPRKRFQGVVTQVRFAETVVNNVVTYQTLIEVENPDLLLRPGMTASITFEVERKDDVLLVPNAALRFDPQSGAAPSADGWSPGRGAKRQPRVFRLVNGVLLETPVTIGISDGSVTQIEGENIEEGTEIVVDYDYAAMIGASTKRSEGPRPGGRPS
ncbi:MAG: efflux RND transporter periplasmic adaptor subunit, partial [Phycisphaerae bacterium]